ncbi:hypothetical protein ACJX0J_039898, partial [Zea mays]
MKKSDFAGEVIIFYVIFSLLVFKIYGHIFSFLCLLPFKCVFMYVAIYYVKKKEYQIQICNTWDNTSQQPSLALQQIDGHNKKLNEDMLKEKKENAKGIGKATFLLNVCLLNGTLVLGHFFQEKTILTGILHYIQVIAFD